MAIGKSVNRIDAIAKVTGRAEYTEDLYKPGMLVARYFRSSIAHGRVKNIDVEKAKVLEGVEAVFTFKDVPENKFATAGHPFSIDPDHQDVADRLLLTRDIRFMGDEIAIVVAQDEIIASKALQLIEISYDEYTPLILPEDILKKDARQIHKGSSNIVGEHQYSTRDLQVISGDVDDALEKADYVVEGNFETVMVQHCHLENHIAYAYMDDLDRIVIVSSTQIPHIVRRIVSEALNMPLSRVRVIKPFIGGGFGNKQDVVLEPMVAFLTLKLDGRAVQINLSREECMTGTRNRHPFHINVKTGVMKDGTMVARKMDAISITGGYASHGHAIAAAGGSKQSSLYPRMATKFHARTLYANIPVAGAMRAYGSPQVIYALECATEDAARKINMDSVEFRLKNIARQDDINLLSGKKILSCGLADCLLKGKAFMDWDKKKKEYEKCKSGPIRKGLGVACLSYTSGTYPVCVEIAGARISLNQDGTVHVMVGATEIGQGSDTIVAQMAAETLGLAYEHVRVVQTQDTDVSPFDTGAYASRQAYVVSNAVFRAAADLKKKILDHAGLMTGKKARDLNIINGKIVDTHTNAFLMDMKTLAIDSFYHKERGCQLTADVSHKTTTNAPVFGCTFVDITVDIPLCKIKINKIINVHDSGIILNPVQAGGQVHGGVFMGIGAALSEELMINPATGYIYNNNLLDYKFPTFMDLPQIHHDFVETFEPTSGYGNKSLGEPPVISPPPAIRNALLDATGVSINSLPISPHKLFTAFKKNGLMVSKGDADV
ncbi:MAG: xanthine dehydrogenase molybdenum-binding subunit XdhA [Deltaproteobacteria bacterium]|uniref:xanthine dehydrogenase subunit XdhA n=1 Tax=Desulfobacula sp. TaxID=2593537 RepID=UPI001993C72C|nr:xanthine dehydrogenase molybdenum-binding subunit XdhA [Candidatus Desulfobacula maris]MBL6993879.1 xanthine dehydrogenase molybdenum-binding subunit XdhA [Desulfobacula sp.]